VVLREMAALVSPNIHPLPTSPGQPDAQCLQMGVNKHRHQNSVLSPEDLSRALNWGADVLTLPNFSLFAKQHLAGWPESFLGKRRDCLAAASSTSESEIPEAPPSQETGITYTLHPTASLLCLSLPQRPSSSGAPLSTNKGSRYDPSSESTRPRTAAARGRGQAGTKSASCNQKKVRADTTPQ